MVVKNIGSISFDAIPTRDVTPKGECTRLYLEILGHPQRIVQDILGKFVQEPEIKGINLETASFADIKAYLDDSSIKKSESIREFCRKIMSLRFPRSFKAEINNVSSSLRKEYEMIDSETQTLETLGACGGGRFGKVRLDNSIKET